IKERDIGPASFPVSSYFTVRGLWEKKVNALELFIKENGDEKIEKQERLVWFIDFYDRNSGNMWFTFFAKKQSLGKSGKWTKGKITSHKILQKYIHNSDCGQIDRKIIQSIEDPYSYGSSNSFTEFNDILSLEYLAQHPLLFSAENESRKMELTKGNFEVFYKEKRDKLFLSAPLKGSIRGNVVIEQVGTYHYQYTSLGKEELRLFNIFGGEEISVPVAEKKRIAAIAGSLTKVVSVHSDNLEINELIDELSVPSAPVAYLELLGEELEVSFWIRPYQEAKKLFRPGAGQSQTVVKRDAKRIKLVRDLDCERNNFSRIIDSVGEWIDFLEEGENTFSFDGLTSALEVLYKLKQLEKSGLVELYWPKGGKLGVHSKILDFEQIKIKRKVSIDWFALEGEVEIDEGLVLTLAELINKSTSSDQKGFIKLEDGAFLKITASLKCELEKIDALSKGDDKSLALHKSALLASQQFFKKVSGIESDKEINKFYHDLDSIGDSRPLPKSTFRAELRDYQLDGYRWLTTLSKLGFGACLADDMGLGKTIQTIALLLDRASDGPALVVAPVSVLMNWEDEISRFAPVLKIIDFRTLSNDERENIITNAGKMEVVLASYGVIQREKSIREKKWSSIVLDEAQAIKNHSTKRAKACHGLLGDFKMVTTGTPVENNMGELWSLFHFINSGLLGGFKNFTRRFTEGEGPQILKQIIAPYILRRKKTEVLMELPSKTEVVLKSKMSKEERSFYEAIRRNAIDSIDENETSGKGIVKVLAELTKLRQASCDPRLISSDFTVRSSKLELFRSLLEKILAGGHKVLVFSQFVRYLKLIETELEELGVSYQYLDGSTTVKKRVKAVQDFQGGVGDVFLISLKAGGFGLNLTAADYVIHMEPWWNPAVEMQATDRAHRIGQNNPVTVYKLVSEHTIEDRIFELHGEKREMAESLLEDSNTVQKLNPKLLLDLLKVH
ncbi:MAG: DEAD/DEAH box helicase, partial [Bacteriovoracaceae bacterium]|nr:DEAD/DEAH box helicase [Bacteriovoracaceae bacterium]